MQRSLSLVTGLLFLITPALKAQELQFSELGSCDLEHGGVIEDCRIGYRTLGTRNSDGSNVVLMPTWYALTV